MGRASVELEDAATAAEQLERALRIEPRNPHSTTWLWRASDFLHTILKAPVNQGP